MNNEETEEYIQALDDRIRRIVDIELNEQIYKQNTQSNAYFFKMSDFNENMLNNYFGTKKYIILTENGCNPFGNKQGWGTLNTIYTDSDNIVYAVLHHYTILQKK